MDSALREGLITQEQYHALRVRMAAAVVREETEAVGRRVLWIGLLLLAIFVASLTLLVLDRTERIVVVSGALTASFFLAIAFWRDARKVTLSRGMLGLTVFSTMVLLLLLLSSGLTEEMFLSLLVPLTIAGTVLGIQQNSTWLASPSAASFYIGFIFSNISSRYSLIREALVASVLIAIAVAILLVSWRNGRLPLLRDAYRRREVSIGQLARGHFALFVLFLPFALIDFLSRIGIYESGVVASAGLVPFLVAFAGVLYARSTRDRKLLTVSSLIVPAVAWLFLPFSRFPAVLWPVALLVTAAVLIYLGITTRQPDRPGGRTLRDPPLPAARETKRN